MTPMFSLFALAIKFDCLFLNIFQSFYLFVSSIFDKLAPPPLNICFKKCFKSLFSPLQCIKQFIVFVESKNVVFFSFCILVDMPMGGRGYSPPPPSSGYATVFVPQKVLSKMSGNVIARDLCPPPYSKILATLMAYHMLVL